MKGRLIDLSIPKIMGVLNVTPDSFYDGGKYSSEDAILHQAEKMLSEGADFLDIGGYSTRPGAADVSPEDERARIVKGISVIIRNFPGSIISVDTFRASVAEAAVECGASIINDVSGGNLDADMFPTVSRLKVPYILMHMKGNPRDMTSLTQYDNLIKEILDYFHQKISALRNAGVKDIIIDPGFGFAKTMDQNFVLLNNLEKFSLAGKPLLAGLSRKSLIWKTLGVRPADALNGTTSLNTIALMKGADILRVHDVREAREVVKLFTSLQVNVNP